MVRVIVTAGFKGEALKGQVMGAGGSAVGPYSHEVPSATASKFTTLQQRINQ